MTVSELLLKHQDSKRRDSKITMNFSQEFHRKVELLAKGLNKPVGTIIENKMDQFIDRYLKNIPPNFK